METETLTRESPPDRPAGSPAFADALEQLREELLAMRPEDVSRMNADVQASVFLVLGVEPELRKLRPQMARWFGEEMASDVDRLELVASAAGQAHAAFLAAEAARDLTPLVEAVAEMRELLLSEVKSLVVRKLVPRSRLGELHGARGYRNQCFDVLQLATILRDDWARLENETGLGRDVIDRADALAHQLARAVSARDEGGATPASELRARAFSLLDRTYDRVRRMVAFLRWNEGDADRIAPSLRRHRRPGRKPTAAETQEETAVETSGAPTEATEAGSAR